MRKARNGDLLHTDSGKICPLCSEAETYVVESRTTNDYVRRTKICGHCGHKFNTAEVAIGDYKIMLEAFRFINKIRVYRKANTKLYDE